MIAALMGTGLSAAAGLNAYIPFLLVGLVARFTDVLTLPDGYRWIESPWALTLGAVLLAAEIVLDKIPAVDTVNDVIGTVVRPATAGLIVAATQAAEHVDSSPWMREHSWVGIVGGITVAGAVHATKAISRPVINVSTGGVGGPVVSLVEDMSAFALSVIALLVPVLVIGAMIVLVWGLWSMWRRVIDVRQRVRDRLDGRPAPS